jgi:hypothetical protein
MFEHCILYFETLFEHCQCCSRLSAHEIENSQIVQYFRNLHEVGETDKVVLAEIKYFFKALVSLFIIFHRIIADCDFAERCQMIDTASAKMTLSVGSCAGEVIQSLIEVKLQKMQDANIVKNSPEICLVSILVIFRLLRGAQFAFALRCLE